MLPCMTSVGGHSELRGTVCTGEEYLGGTLCPRARCLGGGGGGRTFCMMDDSLIDSIVLQTVGLC